MSKQPNLTEQQIANRMEILNMATREAAVRETGSFLQAAKTMLAFVEDFDPITEANKMIDEHNEAIAEAQAGLNVDLQKIQANAWRQGKEAATDAHPSQWEYLVNPYAQSTDLLQQGHSVYAEDVIAETSVVSGNTDDISDKIPTGPDRGLPYSKCQSINRHRPHRWTGGTVAKPQTLWCTGRDADL